MADRVVSGSAAESSPTGREAVCIHTRKIFDSCRDKDCIEDLRLYPLKSTQAYLDGALSVRLRSAELLHVEINVDEIAFNRGFYTVDVKYFYMVRGTVFPGGHDIIGCAVFDKRVILFGSEGTAKVFSSENGKFDPDGDRASNMPVAVVEAVDPIALSMKIVDARKCIIMENEMSELPEYITSAFGEEIALGGNGPQVYVTLGQFSIIRLERETQIMLPSFDYCIPDKECAGAACEEDPCTLFGKIPFPIEEFFPPDNTKGALDYQGFIE